MAAFEGKRGKSRGEHGSLDVCRLAPLKMRLSLAIGALPPQLLGVDQLLSVPPPFHVAFAALAFWDCNSPTIKHVFQADLSANLIIVAADVRRRSLATIVMPMKSVCWVYWGKMAMTTSNSSNVNAQRRAHRGALSSASIPGATIAFMVTRVLNHDYPHRPSSEAMTS